MLDVSSLLKYSTAVKMQKNTIVIKEGAQMPYSMYVILSGTVRVVKNYGEFNQTIVATLSPGDFFGEMSLFLLKPRSATVITAEECVILEINQSNVYEVMENSPQMLYTIVKTLCVRVDALNSRVRGDLTITTP